MPSDSESAAAAAAACGPLLPSNFSRALRLLHSRDPGSVDELRSILDDSIAERYGSTRTMRSRLPSSRCEPERPLGPRESFKDAGGNDVGGKDEVPRISIPDEGQSADGAVCKVCNVPELGPLILIQCRDCAESYHPLCHQPPVVDLYAEDPDFHWRCDECEKRARVLGKTHRTLSKDATSKCADAKSKKCAKKLVKKSAIHNYSIR